MKTKTQFLLLALAGLLPLAVQAQVNYAVSGNTAYVTNSPNATGNIVIAATFEGYPVTSIGNFAFNFSSLTSVTISSNVTTIGEEPFSYGSGLTAIMVDAQNKNYSSVNGVLFDKSQTMLIQYPPAATGQSYAIPGSVTNIADGAFVDSSSLSNVMTPNSVTSIGDSAFGFSGLTSVTIPSSVTNIGFGAFVACSHLAAITVDAQNDFYSSTNGALFNQNQTTLVEYPDGLGGSYTIPTSVTNIGAGAFELCSGLTSVTIPGGVTGIGNFAFAGCSGLLAANFAGNAPTPGLDAFQDDNSTVYYLPATLGWSQFLSGTGLSGMLWNPQIQAGDGSFGVRANQFGFTITGISNLVVVVAAATNLASPLWTPVVTNTLTDGSSYFSDPQLTNYPSRFYRLNLP